MQDARTLVHYLLGALSGYIDPQEIEQAVAAAVADDQCRASDLTRRARD